MNTAGNVSTSLLSSATYSTAANRAAMPGSDAEIVAPDMMVSVLMKSSVALRRSSCGERATSAVA